MARTRRAPHHGWTVIAACTAAGSAGGHAQITGVPVVGNLDEVADRVAALEVDVVAVSPVPGWTPRRLQALAWALEGTGVDLVVDPGLMEIGGPRLHVAPVDGLPMLRLTEPHFDGVTRTIKVGVDRAVALALLLVLAPVFLVIALLVKREGGPVFYRQERVGLNGSTFRMIKFRSMVVGADKQDALLAAADEGAGPLFKVKADPRVTKVGATLRRHSLDELPQLLNVLAGSMSLVGPRPPLARRGRDLHGRCPPQAARPPRDHGALAGQRTIRPIVGGVGPARPPLRRELVGGTRRHHPLEDRGSRRPTAGSILRR